MKSIKRFTLILLVAVMVLSCKKDTVEPCNGAPIILNLGNDTTITEGAQLTLDAGNPGSSYVWSTGEQTRTIQVDTAGIFWVMVTNCLYSDKDSLTVLLRYNTVKVETDFGNFRIWLYHKTPGHRQNFLALTNSGFYDSLIFHRVVEDFVIQGGDPEGTGYGGPGYTIPAEIVPGLDHVYGAVGAARQSDYYNPDKESNGSQYYIVCDPDGEPYLNGDYTVFGFVFAGIESVFQISQVAVDTNDKPLDDVFMKQVSVELYTASELQDMFGFTIP
jgi:cyclophilin family peptidyl-prolyl cis-trans isomerase